MSSESSPVPPRDYLQFVEDVGLTFEEIGLPRMMGRVLGWLLIADPPHQSFDELADVLQASRGSISTSTRGLIQTGLVERVSFPGQRRAYYRLRENGWSAIMERRMSSMSVIRRLAERGLDLLSEEPEDRRRRLEEMRSLYAFFEREMPALIERWRKERAAS